MEDKTYKYEGRTFLNKQSLYQYIQETKQDELTKLGWEPSRYWFYVKYGKKEGTSVISGKPTKWNPVTERYERFNEDEREEYVRQFQERMKGKYGTTHLTKDPEHQKKMLAQRGIGTDYIWKDGTHTSVTGTYEYHFLHFIETVYNFKAAYLSDPPSIYYKDTSSEADKDKVRFYLPDFFVPSLNLIVEVKGTNDHYQERDKYKEELKKKATEAEGFDFVQVNDKHYSSFNRYFIEKVVNR